VLSLCVATSASAQTASLSPSSLWDSYVAGNWSLTVGGYAESAPTYQGARSNSFFFVPMFSLGKSGAGPAFISRNDSPSIALYDNGWFRAGVVGSLIYPRTDSASNNLRGLSEVSWGAQAGGFAEVYPTNWLRVRGELRQGFVSYYGLVGDVAADAFYDLTPAWRISAGPRLELATANYFKAYYGVDAYHSLLSGLSPYWPSGGVNYVGAGGALTWKTTDKITTSLFAEYQRLAGPAADSSLVRERGSDNQLTIGVSAAYRFDFSVH
jgi:outer membrane protein